MAELIGQKAMSIKKGHHRTSLSDMDDSFDHFDDGGRNSSCCFALCAWACFLSFIIMVILIFVGISYLLFLQSGMPNVNVRAINITKLEFNNQNKMNSILYMDLKVSNNNDKLTLMYSTLSVLVLSEKTKLGETKIERFSQSPKSDTDFEMKMTMDNVDVNKYAVEDIKSDISFKELAYDIYVQGKIGFKVGGFLKMNNVPFLASCQQIKQRDVDLGKRPGCDVTMFSFRPTTN